MTLRVPCYAGAFKRTHFVADDLALPDGEACCVRTRKRSAAPDCGDTRSAAPARYDKASRQRDCALYPSTDACPSKGRHLKVCSGQQRPPTLSVLYELCLLPSGWWLTISYPPKFRIDRCSRAAFAAAQVDLPAEACVIRLLVLSCHPFAKFVLSSV